MKKTEYIVEITARSGGKVVETYQSDGKQLERLKELTEGNMTNTDIHEIKCSEIEVDDEAKTFVKDIALISSIITGEFFKALLIKTLLSHYEVSRLIANLSITCYVSFERFPADKDTPHEKYRENVLEWAKSAILDKHNIKL